jgi:AcrR family transcriptional regulator
MRADARRNYESLLARAHEAFTEQGTDASLEDIARRAGVGIGTLYRHFPTRQALLLGLLSQRLRTLATYAEGELDQQEPREAMVNWIRAMAEHGRTYRGTAVAIMSELLGDDDRAEFDEACAVAQAASERVLRRAQDAGVVRSDVTRAHLVALVHGLVLATEHKPQLFDQLLAVVLDGLMR